MAKEFSDIGNGNGFIHVTGPDGLASSMVTNLPNDGEGLRQAKLLAVQAAATSANLISTGSVTITALGGSVLNITGIGIGAIDQMGGSVNVSGLTIAQAAEQVSANINNFKPGSGPDYTAAAINGTIFLFAPRGEGSTPNGDTVSASTDDPGNITFTTIDMAGGADANSIFDEAHGFRFFLDADYLASASSCTGEGTAVQGDLSNAIEITNQIITIIATLQTDEVEIVNDSIAPTRKGKVTFVEVNTEASAASDDLITINPAGFAEGDIIQVRGQVLGRVVTLKEAGNIDMASATSFDTGGYERVITLQLWAKGGSGGNELFWFEVSRSVGGVSAVTDFRTALFPFIATEGQSTLASSTGGTTILTANVDDRTLLIVGASSLTSNLIIDLDTTGAVAGDEFFISYQAQIIEGAFEVRIEGGTTYIFTTSQALIGGWLITAYFDGADWNLAIAPDIAGSFFQLESKYILDGAITPAKLAGDGAAELITFPVSLDDTDELGDHKITMPFAGTVIGIDYAISKDIQAANDGSIVAKDNTAGVMATTSITGGSAIGTIFSESPTVNNTFVAGDILTFTSSKSTVGGKVLVSLKLTRA